MTTDHYHVLLDCKNNYINKLCTIVTEPIKNKFKNIYTYSKQICITNNNPNNIFKQFQNELVLIPKWDNATITEQISIICNSKNIDWFDELLKAIFISNNKIINLVHNENVVHIEIPNTKLFIHTLYTNIAREFWKNPYPFYHKSSNQMKITNNNLIDKCIVKHISNTIEEFLPIEEVVKTLNKSLKNNKEINIKTLHLEKEYKTKLQKREEVLLLSEQELKNKEEKIIKIKKNTDLRLKEKEEEVIKLKRETQDKERQLQEKEKQEQKRLKKEEGEKLEQEKLEGEKLEQEKLEQEKLEQEKLEQEKLEQEKLEKEKLEQEKLEQEKLEGEKLEQEKLEQEKINSHLDEAVSIAKLSSELANSVTTSVENEIKNLQEMKSIEINLENFNKDTVMNNDTDDVSQDSLHSDDEVSFFNDARLF
jgi:hypothetical protein